MIAFARQKLANAPTGNCSKRFEPMIAIIREKARFAFRRHDPETREELIQEVIANALVAFRRLCELGKADVAYPTPLADFGIRQVYAGRRVGAPLNSEDVMSEYAQRRRGFYVTSYDGGEFSNSLQQLLTSSSKWTPADHACSRLDFAEWLRRLPRNRRQIVRVLAAGESTKAAAKRFGVSPGRISQVRRELQANWSRFHGELADNESKASVVTGC